MSDIVVSKIIDFKARDNATGVITRIKQAQDTLKDKDIHLTAVGDETKITSFHQKLDGLPKDVQATLKAMAEKNGFDTFEAYMRSLPKEQYAKLKAIVERTGFEAYKSDLKSLPKSQQTELKSKLDDSGFRTFKEWYDKVPKEARTQLNAIANKVPVEDFIHVTKEIPNHVITKVTVDGSSAINGMRGINSAVDETKSKFGRLKETMAGTFAGQMIAAGAARLVDGLKSATAAGMAYNKEQDTMKTVWTSLTTEAPRDGKELVNYINSLSQHSIYAADTINKMAQSFYHVHSNVKETQAWTKSFVALGSTLHMSNDALAESGEQFAKIVAGGKASSEDMAVMINRFPMFGEALQKATGKSMKQLYDMSAKGKLSATQFTEALSYLGKKYSSGTKEAMTSYMGMGMYIHSRFSTLMGDVMTQSFNTTKSASNAIKDLLSDDSMKKYANAISAASSTVLNGIGNVIKYIDGHKDTIMKIGKDVGEIASTFGKAVWNDIKSIMTTIASMFGLTGKNAKDSADPLKTFERILSAAAKHKKSIQAIAGALVAIKGFKMAKGAFDPLFKIAGIGSKDGGLLTKVIGTGKNQKKVFRFGVEGINDAKLKIADFITGTKANFTALFNFISKGFQGGKFSKTSVGNMSMGSKIATAGATVGVAATAGLDIVGAIKAKNPKEKFEGFGKAAGGAIGGGIGFMLGGPAGEAIGAMLGRTIGKYGGIAAKNFTDGWNKAGRGAKPPKGIIQKAGYYSRKAGDAVAEWTKGITTWMGKHKKEILLTLANPFLGIGAFILKDTKTGKSVAKWVSGLEKSVKAATKGKKGLGNNLVGAFKGVGDWLLKDKSTKKGFDKWMAGLSSSVKNATKGKKGLLSNITGTFEGVSKWLQKDKGTKKAAQKWSDELSNVFSGKKGFARSFSNSLDLMEKSLKKSKFGKSWDRFWKDTQKTTISWDKNINKWWSKFSKNFGKNWDKSWKDANKTMHDDWKNMHSAYDDFTVGINKWWSKFSKSFGKNWDRSWKDRKTDMHDDWKSMHSAYDDFTTGISKWWSSFSTSFAKSWNQSWKDRQTDMHDNWKNMHSAYDDFTTGINSWWSGFKSNFQSGWDSFWKGIQKFFADIFGTFKGLAHDAMKGVVGAINGGIGGINTVIKFFGGKAQSIAPIKYASGVGYHPGGPALINDQKGSVFEEAFKNPGEPWRIIPKMRNVMVDLKPGATVVPASETARRFVPSSIPHYAGGVGGWVKGELSDMGKWVKDKLEGITSFLKDPLGNLISVWDKATSKITQPTKFGGAFAPPAGHYVVKQSINWFKDQMNKLKDKELEAQSVAGEPKAAQAWLPIVKKILEQMGAKPPKGIDWEAAAFVREIARESGGNPAIRQTISDVNSAAGNPAMGLLQFIPQTFMAYAVPGHTNILSGEDQIMATANAYMHSGAWDRIGTGEQINFLANGGHMYSPTPSIFAEDGDEFAINPSKPSAIPLVGDLMGRIADFHPEFRSSNLANNISADIGRKLEMVIDLLGSINNKDFAPEINISKTSSNLNQQNRRNTDIYAYQRGDRQ